MKILVINAGSSSLKYQLFDMANESVLAKGLCERIGIDGRLKHEAAGKDAYIVDTAMKNHADAIKIVLDTLVSDDHGVIGEIGEISAVGHRFVHAGEYFSKSVLITEEVLKRVEECVALAPLHNPPNITGYKACVEVMGKDVPQVAVFDTAFHQTMPNYAYCYGLPYEYYEKYKIRRYGFHGTSHRYVSKRASEMLGNRTDLKIITCHLGNGSSIAAVNGGKSVDTSMGFTPLPGPIMGTRCGDIDPAIVTFLMEKEGLTTKQVDDLMNKKSGALGISGISSDFRDIDAAAAEGNARAALAKEMFCYGVKKLIGAYAAAMGGVDAIVFTAGIGENSTDYRAKMVEGLEYMGAKIDLAANKVRGKDAVVSTDDSRVKILVVPTNEELMIALDTKEVVGS